MMIILLSFITLVSCSMGDGSALFQHCLWLCLQSPNATATMGPMEHILQWTLREECEYQCARRDVVRRQNKEDPNLSAVAQYYGCWSFQRVAGMEELGSVVFSLLHMVLHLRGGYDTCTTCFAPHSATRKAWVAFVVFWTNGWFWSAVYHARHKHFAMVLDYMGAQLAMFGALYFAVVYTVPFVRTRSVVIPFTFIMTMGYGVHSYHMLWVHFDYGWNMKVGIIIGIAHHLAFLRWCLRRPFTVPQQYMLGAVLVISGASVFELYDFPPLFFETTDAHALWHGCTLPATVLWYRFARCHRHAKIHDLKANV